MSPEGLERKTKQEEKENEWLAAKLRKSDEASKVQKSAEVARSGAGGSSGSGLTTEDRKRCLESDIRLGIEESCELAKIQETKMQVEAQRGEKRKGDEADDCDREDGQVDELIKKTVKFEEIELPHQLPLHVCCNLSVQTDSYLTSSMEVFCVGSKLQDDFKWELNEVSDMCEPDPIEYEEVDLAGTNYDEKVWGALDSRLGRLEEQVGSLQVRRSQPRHERPQREVCEGEVGPNQ